MHAGLSQGFVLRVGLYPRLEGPGTSSSDHDIHSVAAALEIRDCRRHKRIVWPTQKGLHLVTTGGPAENKASQPAVIAFAH